tara:strand:- start:75 stop:476 length:402 start_codon:yes stop_codon:yes gene_type:complete
MLYYPVKLSTPATNNFVKLTYDKSKPSMTVKPTHTDEQVKAFFLAVLANPRSVGRLLHNYSFWFCDVQLKAKPETINPVSLEWAAKYLKKNGDKLFFSMTYRKGSWNPCLNISLTPREEILTLGTKQEEELVL